MHAEIKVGDVVRLKSGGPEMTVKNVGKGTLGDHLPASCDWFDGAEANEGLVSPDVVREGVVSNEKDA
jgi:uncharacterized protein YodC (DUF2158 family)